MFFPGASMDNAFFSVDLFVASEDYDGVILLGEGYATMAKVYELTGLPCVATMSCHRLDEIAHLLRAKFPNSKIIITADNDKATELKTGRNPGMIYSEILYKAHIVQDIIAPDFEAPEDGSDWDDYALKYGDIKTKNFILQRLRDAVCSS